MNRSIQLFQFQLCLAFSGFFLIYFDFQTIYSYLLASRSLQKRTVFFPSRIILLQQHSIYNTILSLETQKIQIKIGDDSLVDSTNWNIEKKINFPFNKMPSPVFFIIIMGKKSSRIGKIPAFIKKLVQILDDHSSIAMICWLPEGNGFQILNITSFTQNILPKHFKHRNMASFVRQLNMYGFCRPKQSDQNVYINPRFQRGNMNNMKFIKRKVTQAKNSQDQQICQQVSKENSNQSSFKKNFFEKYQKLMAQNGQLKKTNQELLLKLSQFQDIKTKIRQYTEQMGKFIAEPDNVENQKAEKQANSSNASTQNFMSSSDNSIKRGFRILNNFQRPDHQYSYQILLGGLPKVEQSQRSNI